MTDPGQTRVVTDNLREEAGKWRDLAGRMGEVNRNPVGNNGLALEPQAFFIGPTELVATGIHYAAYESHYEYIRHLVAGAVTEWDQLGVALDNMAEEFDRTDQTQKADLDKIYSAEQEQVHGRISDL